MGEFPRPTELSPVIGENTPESEGGEGSYNLGTLAEVLFWIMFVAGLGGGKDLMFITRLVCHRN